MPLGLRKRPRDRADLPGTGRLVLPQPRQHVPISCLSVASTIHGTIHMQSATRRHHQCANELTAALPSVVSGSGRLVADGTTDCTEYIMCETTSVGAGPSCGRLPNSDTVEARHDPHFQRWPTRCLAPLLIVHSYHSTSKSDVAIGLARCASTQHDPSGSMQAVWRIALNASRSCNGHYLIFGTVINVPAG